MNIETVLETHSVALGVTGAPDVPVGGRLLVPDLITVTYQWTPPAQRRSGEKYLRVQVKVSGVRRLKSGAIGRQGGDVLLDEHRGYPKWVGDLVASLIPEGWDR